MLHPLFSEIRQTLPISILFVRIVPRKVNRELLLVGIIFRGWNTYTCLILHKIYSTRYTYFSCMSCMSFAVSFKSSTFEPAATSLISVIHVKSPIRLRHYMTFYLNFQKGCVCQMVLVVTLFNTTPTCNFIFYIINSKITR